MSPTLLRMPRWAAFAALLATLHVLPGTGPAQVPPGTAIVGTSVAPGSTGTSGLYLVPLAGGPPVAVTGLPPAVRAPSGTGFFGVGTMDLRRDDGGIVVGTVVGGTPSTPSPLDVYVFYVDSTGAVIPAATAQVTLGQVSATSGAFVAAMSDGRVLVAASDGNGFLTNGPMAGHAFAIVDIWSATVTPVLTPGVVPIPGSLAGGLAVDPTGRYAYFLLTLDVSQPTRVATLYRIDLDTSADSVLAAWTGHVASGMSVDDDGAIHVSASDGNTLQHFVHVVQPQASGPATVTSTQTVALPGPIAPSGIAFDRAAPGYVVASGAAPGFFGPQQNSVFTVDQSGAAALLASPPPGGWGSISRQGIAVVNAMDSYGPPSDGLGRYWFENFPNPGGQPLVGNAGFTLTMASDPAAGSALASWIALSLGRAAIPFAGIEVLIDPATVVLQSVAATSPASTPLPIPNTPSLAGFALTAQGLVLETNLAFAASRGLSITMQ